MYLLLLKTSLKNQFMLVLCMSVWNPVYSVFSYLCFCVKWEQNKALCCTLVFRKIFVQWLFSFCCPFKEQIIKVVSVDKWNTHYTGYLKVDSMLIQKSFLELGSQCQEGNTVWNSMQFYIKVSASRLSGLNLNFHS